MITRLANAHSLDILAMKPIEKSALLREDLDTAAKQETVLCFLCLFPPHSLWWFRLCVFSKLANSYLYSAVASMSLTNLWIVVVLPPKPTVPV